ncbi:hypothetical protein DENSPDRAFT_854409 [Dentipellis sp. KUC8613]|nr:hypothetical protein DENSPDRAFT_854409 [Dentipellis sp. KUC8613]
MQGHDGAMQGRNAATRHGDATARRTGAMVRHRGMTARGRGATARSMGATAQSMGATARDMGATQQRDTARRGHDGGTAMVQQQHMGREGAWGDTGATMRRWRDEGTNRSAGCLHAGTWSTLDEGRREGSREQESKTMS